MRTLGAITLLVSASLPLAAQGPWSANVPQHGVGLVITEDAGGVAQRTINQLGASAGYTSGQVRPALHIIVPMDDEYNSTVGIVVGFGLAVVMK
jgi:hypothetical protein